MEWFKQIRRLFGWKNVQYESLLEFSVGNKKVRVWTTHTSLRNAEDHKYEFRRETLQFLVDNSEYQSNEDLIKLICKNEPDVACIAITNENGNGISYYPDWH